MKVRFVPQLSLMHEKNQRRIINPMAALIGNIRIVKPIEARREALGSSIVRDNWGTKPNSALSTK